VTVFAIAAVILVGLALMVFGALFAEWVRSR
jgi:hypothetical protein